MRNFFDTQLSELHKQLIEMGALCEKAINLVSSALHERDSEAYKVMAEMEIEIDQMERDIETFCLKLLLKQQPVARDLRQISAALKMITDMERIGDQAADISEIISCDGFKPSGEDLGIGKMASATGKMVTDSIDAYVSRDISKAQEVIDYDDRVDKLFEKIKKQLIELISQDSSTSEYALDLLMIAKYFERIGDHAVNIAEWVKFSVTGVHEGGID